MNLGFSRQIFKKYPNSKFHENPASGSGRTNVEADRRTGMTKLTVAFRYFAKSARKLKAEMTASTEKHHNRNTG
jgi:hypothetical protein